MGGGGSSEEENNAAAPVRQRRASVVEREDNAFFLTRQTKAPTRQDDAEPEEVEDEASPKAIARQLSEAEEHLHCVDDSVLHGLDQAFRAVSFDRERLEDEGLSSRSFTLGVLNVCASAFIAGAAPEAYWIWNTAKAAVIVIYQIVRWIPHKMHFYALDFCWVMSLLTLLWGLSEMFGVMPPEYGARCFLIIFTIGAGPLAWSVPALQNKLVFHSFEYTSTLFIHLSPSVAVWGLRWFHHSAARRFPDRLLFLRDIDTMFPSTSLILSLPLLLYVAWWLPYTFWLITRGVYMPDRGYDTVFDFNRRKMGFDKMKGLRHLSLRQLALAYMLGHAAAVTMVMFWAQLCWQSFWLHTSFLVLCFTAAAVQGSSYYNYWLGKRYARAIAKIIAEARDSEAKKKRE